MSEYFSSDIQVLLRPDHPTRLAFLLAYRQGLQTSPAVAWDMALAIARERFPRVSDRHLRGMLLLALGLFGAPKEDVARIMDGHPPNLSNRSPVMISSCAYMRLPGVARHFGLTVDDLASLILGAWVEAACDFDGNVLDARGHDYIKT